MKPAKPVARLMAFLPGPALTGDHVSVISKLLADGDWILALIKEYYADGVPYWEPHILLYDEGNKSYEEDDESIPEDLWRNVEWYTVLDEDCLPPYRE